MQTHFKLPGLTILLLASLFLPQAAEAFYNPSTGRWLSRDPVTEPGFEMEGTENRRSVLTEKHLLLKAGAQNLDRKDWNSIRSWMTDLSDRQRRGAPPYSHVAPETTGIHLDADHTEACSECNLYGFNQNDGVDHVDPLGLRWADPPPIPILFGCLTPKCGRYVCIGLFHPPTWFPKNPVALKTCMDLAETRMLLSCLVANQENFSFYCAMMYECLKENW